jgi:hypothetical protein
MIISNNNLLELNLSWPETRTEPMKEKINPESIGIHNQKHAIELGNLFFVEALGLDTRHCLRKYVCTQNARFARAPQREHHLNSPEVDQDPNMPVHFRQFFFWKGTQN